MREPWYRNAVFYELYLRAFQDGDGNGHGDFRGLRLRLDYLQWLGVDCVWLLPINPSPLRDDGYDIASFYGIHPDYGLLEDFQLTVEEIHRRGMRIIVDLVLNHTSDEHPWFQEARRSRNSPLRDWYVWSDTDQRYADARIIFLDTERSNWAWDEASGQFYWHRFYSSQPDLNYENPAVRAAMKDALRFWLRLGVDGFRADAVPYLFEEEGTNCENLPRTHDYLRELRTMLAQEYPDAILLAEANQWPNEVREYFGESDEFHLCFHFPLMPRIFLALARADRQPLVEILAQTPPPPPACQWATFLRNHDELTLEMVSEEERQYLWSHYAPRPEQRLNLGIRRRLAPLLGNDRRRIALLYSLLLTLPGAPVLYYGDEIGMGEDLRQPDRNGVRTPMQWEAGANAGFSSAPAAQLYVPPIADAEYGYARVNVADQRAESGSLLRELRSLIAARKGMAALATDKLRWLTDAPPPVAAYWRGDDLLALHNLSGDTCEVMLPAGEFADALEQGASVSGALVLPPYGYRWLRLSNSA